MKRGIIFLCVIAFVVAVMGAVGIYVPHMTGYGLRGDGIAATEKRAIPNFSSVDVGGVFDVQWTSGEPTLSISTDQNLLPHIKTVVSNDTLKMYFDVPVAFVHGIKVVVSSPALRRVEANGAVHFVVNHISGPSLHIEGNGAVNIAANGSVDEMTVELNGAGRLDAADLQSKKAKVALRGASRSEISVSEALQATIQGAGSLVYSGDPKSVEKSVAGAGTIRQRK